VLWTSGGRLYGRAPAGLQDLIEVRGLDVVRVPRIAFAEVTVIVRLAAVAERIPDFHTENVLGIAIPTLDVAAFEASGRFAGASVKSWLFGIAANLVRGYARRERQTMSTEEHESSSRPPSSCLAFSGFASCPRRIQF